MDKISSRAIIGEFFRVLNAETGIGWVNAVSGTPFSSDQSSEEYAWLGMVPAMQEWVNGRKAKGLRDQSYKILNKKYEATIDILVDWLRRDKTGQAMRRIRELALRSNTHWASLLSQLVLDGASKLCYDGQYFFDTDHEEGDSGVQSNKINVDISALPAEVHGAITAPSPEEMQQAILKSIIQIQGFVDDQGEPMNENANSFLVMVPTSLQFAALNGIAINRGTGLAEQLAVGTEITVAANPRLSSWTDQFATFRTGGNTTPLIRQEETEIALKAKAEGSDYEFDNDRHQYGVDANRGVGYGFWQDACHVTLI